MQPFDPTPGAYITDELHRAGFDANWVADRLYMGGAPIPRFWESLPVMPSARHAVQLAPFGFNLLVLTAYEIQPPSYGFPGVAVKRISLDDTLDMPHAALLHQLHDLVEELHAAYLAGQRILVTCARGRNRSGLVTALTLRRRGYSAEQAIHDVRAARRHVGALTNSTFVQLIERYRVGT